MQLQSDPLVNRGLVNTVGAVLFALSSAPQASFNILGQFSPSVVSDSYVGPSRRLPDLACRKVRGFPSRSRAESHTARGFTVVAERQRSSPNDPVAILDDVAADPTGV